MIELTLAQIADIVGGTLHDVPDPQATVTGTVEFDSREIGSGDLFLALPGARVDGHDFAATAIEKGAVAVLGARPVGVPAIVVPVSGETDNRVMALESDTDGAGAAVLTALGDLAAYCTKSLAADGLTVVGVTGSAGKTSTKDLIAAVLRPLGETVAPPGSFNNEIGHPWTALRATASTKFLVLEMSARGEGHIAALAKLAPPRIGVELNVGTAHLGEFGSREAIARAKGELVEALPVDGVAVLNADDAAVAAMASRTAARVVFYGTAEAQVRATDVVLDAHARAAFTLHTAGGTAPVALKVHGEHQVHNALASAAVGLECGATTAQVAEALSGAGAASPRRMDVFTTDGGVTVVNDTYNANPDAMRAALRSLVLMSEHDEAGERLPGRDRRRTFAVLGEMGELGEESILEHDRLGRFLVRLDITSTICVGSSRAVHALWQGAVMEGSWGSEAIRVDTRAEAVERLRAELRPGDLVLVKASKSEKMWEVAESLGSAGNAENEENMQGESPK
ncbi:UDP-N-acetylmuramoyl-tripeptide--D-alanyl-D-alanine ligase OS=Tsukamurella paurometabola (strain ATCC 8368 / DSM / CCUG 35730 / CIP 100753 / JCM 10117 /KCTC 9821 / NBRC 16120 / NCIMB 702349 / NCTC 13040) OX=521096 GN=murF PE=3 SV=1 [Tsukamurella paurometabola]|uniref:UDP-N-acetylmuramoyl-tripeptide--D-alanyl-D-alanine ligase n=1 Tax=Tsukamurella paurometabola (strain ATCC 8368 / DSM 20162 / CCUG 35730 / CIP 100753 / JCM 10117 / KCTC 9821 / NBRC 16120 / NCIMB 702349 / NCTC 13040) TaxID=521096 RepID=D5USH9_TSUPD|nr:UDP-N-acetylmuramoyl-tripeptide--D-alanyl-D-alanine ligase [Tsukamurella paurometabola]ADG79250.1 UDP-N-acetylmuramoylalanyl-D-glutamyl-2,6-diamin opimelate/D-alanyl-D-alanylligase [Tsukamurella paurometabola DSM 20162]SUP34763.1 UDP-N-acetylmuramoyl-tripeptide--D-alanyl-D-alanine ligase [Tsukamurella paurometabola]